MALNEDIAWVGQLLDHYSTREPLHGVASSDSRDSGVPPEMQAGQIDADGWVEWRVLPSTLKEEDVIELENRFGVQLPPLFRAYLLARFHLFDQVTSRRYDQLIFMSDIPSRRPLEPLSKLISAWRPMIAAGFIPFAEWGDSWGPMCFDTGRCSPDGDCPIVWMDHEVLPHDEKQLGSRNKVLPLAQPLYGSCREFLLDLFGDSDSNVTETQTSESPRFFSRTGWGRLIRRFFR